MTQSPAQRRSYPFSLHLDYWSACVDPRLAVNGVPIAQTRHPSPSTNWPECLTDVLDRIRRTRIGRAVIRHLRRRTTMYLHDGRPGALPDPYPLDDSSGGPLRPSPEHFSQARTVGCEAVVVIDPAATAFHNQGGLLSTSDVSLFHELVHALAITHGQHRTADTRTAQYRASSREEAYAVVLENMYRDEARYGLRRNYLDHSAIPYAAAPTPRNTDIPLTDLERRLVVDWRRGISAFVNEVENIPEHVCRYNPFRALRNRHLYIGGR